MIVVISTGESAADARQVLRDMAAGDVELVSGSCVASGKHGNCAHVGIEIIGTIDESDWIADVRWSVTELAAAPKGQDPEDSP